jgi:hypothetical protein
LNDLQLRDRPIFICGHPKSGTSLLRAILDSHPQLVVYPEETIFFRRYLPIAKGQPLEKQLELAEQYLIHIFTWNQAAPPSSQAGFPDRDYTNISYEAVRQRMHQLAQKDYRDERDILNSAVLAYGSVSGQLSDETRRWVEKSPYNEYFASLIFDWWPEARCVHVVRDARDNFVSYQRKHTSWSPEIFASNWKRSTQAGIQNRQQFGDEHYRMVRYEDLVTHPEKYAQELMAFLGIDWNPASTSPTRAGQQWQGNSMFSEQFSEISAAPVGRWKEKLQLEEALVIEQISEAEMLMMDYDLIASDSPFIVKSKARVRVAAWPIRRRIQNIMGKKPPALAE